MNHLGLFEGIGGFSLAAHWAGWQTVAWCEINQFCQQVLKYHFPKAKAHEDIKQTDFSVYRGRVDIITGGFPCQPYSTAGKRLGKEDDRHLWPEMLRTIREIRPKYVVGENVSGLISWSGGLVFDEVQADLEAEGYEVWAFVLPACGVDAPHRRDRVWFVAHATRQPSEWMRPKQRSAGESQQGQFRGSCSWMGDRAIADASGNRRQRQWSGIEAKKGLQPRPESTWKLERGFEGFCGKRAIADTNSNERSERRLHQERPEISKCNSVKHDARNTRRTWENFPTQSPVCGGDDGFSPKLDGITFSKWRSESVKAYGNAIVPQVALQIFLTINEFESSIKK